MEKKKLTLKDVASEAGCPPYIVRYLLTCGRLQVIKHSTGQGNYVEFHPDSIQIVKNHVQRNK